MRWLDCYHQLDGLEFEQLHESVMPSNHLILCRPLLLLPSTFPSIRVFAKESEFAYLPPNLESPLSYPRPVLLLVSYRVDQWESSCS